MSSRFSANLAFLLFVNILIKPFYLFIIDRGVQNASGETYGLYAALLSTSLLFYILLDLGITHFNNREVAQNEDKVRELFPKLLLIKIGLVFLYGIVALSLGLVLNYGVIELKWLFWLCINQAILSMILFIRSFVSGLQLFRTDAVLSIADKLLLILIAGGLLVYHAESDFPLEQFIYAQTASYSLALIFSVILLRPYLRSIPWRLPEFSASINILKKALPYASIVLMMTLYYRLDTIMLERMLGMDALFETSNYVAAFRQMDAAQNIAILFTVILLPLYARLIKEQGAYMDIAAKSFGIIGTFAVAVIIPCIFVSAPIMQLLYPDMPAEYSGKLLSILMLSFFPMCCIFIYGTLLTADAKLIHLNWIVLTGVLLNFTLNLIFIPIYKAEAAAITSLATQCLVASLKLWFVYKLFGPLMPKVQVIKWAIFLTVVMVVNFLLFNLPLHWVVLTISSVLMTFVISLVSGLVKIQSIGYFLNRE